MRIGMSALLFASATGPRSAPVARGLQPGLRRGGALLPVHDLGHVLEREPDVVEALEEPHAIGGRNPERDVAAAPSAAMTRAANASAASGASTIGSRPFCRQFSR